MLQSYLRTLFSPEVDREDFGAWRDRVLSAVLLVAVVLGSLVAVPSVVLALSDGLWPVAFFDVIAVGWVVTIWLKRSLSLRARAWNLCVLLYLLGLALLVTVGGVSQIYLMAFPVMAALFLGPRPALLALLLNAVTLPVTGYLANADLQLMGFAMQPLVKWIVISANFTFVSSVITVSIVVLLDGLEKVLARKRASEERFRGLIEQSLTGIYILQEGVFRYANPRLEQLLGYGPGELIGVRAEDIVLPEDAPTLLAERDKLRLGAASVAYEIRVRRRDGSYIELGIQGRNYQMDGAAATIGMAQDITEKKRAEEQAQDYLTQLRSALLSTVDVATTLSELRDPYTAGHERRVGKMAAAIGAELGMDHEAQEGLRVAGYLHDIGKITVPAEVLSKPGKLSAIEYRLIQEHAQAGYEVLKNVEFPWPVAQVALQHHERMDGSGYPQGLKGEAIALEARILAVADVVEAMHSHRPYRPTLGLEAALAEIERLRGTTLDAQVVDACLKLFRDEGYTIPE